MPQWVHLPLILKPDGNGKLSKRDGDRLGFPVYAQNWTDPKTGDLTNGFKELGFMPEAFVNLLAMLGWNDGSDQEVFSLPELIEKFSIERVSKAGAKFDFEKAKWYNHEWIKMSTAEKLLPHVKQVFSANAIPVTSEGHLLKIIDLIKDRCNLLSDFVHQGNYFFIAPDKFDIDSVKPKWSLEKAAFFDAYAAGFDTNLDAQEQEQKFKSMAVEHGFKPGELMLPFRVMLVGGKFGPGIFDIALELGTQEVKERIKAAITAFN
jgi:glutamyl-tRNA synthetase